MSVECPQCGDEFKHRNAMSVHRQAAHDVPWQNRELMYRLYVEKRILTSDIAERFDTTSKTILRWLDRHGIEKRDAKSEQKRGLKRGPAPYESTERGYTRWTLNSGDESKIMYVHRLLAISEYGVDAVRGNDVHHVNEIRYDNRPENIELVNKSDHGRHHADRRWENESAPSE